MIVSIEEEKDHYLTPQNFTALHTVHVLSEHSNCIKFFQTFDTGVIPRALVLKNRKIYTALPNHE